MSWARDLAEGGAAGAAPWDVFIYSKETATAALLEQDVAAQGLGGAVKVVRVAENWGEEALPYLLFIVEHYEALPPR